MLKGFNEEFYTCNGTVKSYILHVYVYGYKVPKQEY